MTTTELQAGQTYTWAVTGLPYSTHPELASGEAVSRRGTTFVVTDQLRQSNLDREGRCWLDLLADESAQIAKWGHVVAVPGAVALTPWTPGTVEHSDARAAAREVALAQPDPQKRAEALREVDHVFGRDENPSHQTSTWQMGDDERAELLRGEGRR